METAIPDDILAAVRRGEMKKVIKWLRKGDVNAQRPDGNTLLHTAVLFEQPDLMRELLRRGATVDSQNNDGSTSLMAAAQLGDTEAVQILLKHSADVDAQCCTFGPTALMSAAHHQQPEVMAILLNASAQVDVQTSWGENALMTAAKVGADRCVTKLLEAGADVELRDCDGMTALDHAEKSRRASTQLLLQRCSPESQNQRSSSPIPANAVRLRTQDGRLLTVPESALQKAGSSARRRKEHPKLDAGARRRLLVNAVLD